MTLGLAAVLLAVLSLLWRASDAAHAGPLPGLGQKPAVITLGMQTSPASALVMVAKDKGFFERAGVSVELKEFTAGKFALQAFLGGSLDAVVSGEVPVLLAFLHGHRLRVVTQVVEATSNEIRIVARRDGTDENAARFFKAKKRTLATSFGGGPEYFTYRALKEFGVGAGEVTLISQRPEDMPAALASGSVDAVSIFDPFALMAEKQLGAEAAVFRDCSSYAETYLLSVSQQLIDARPEAASGLIAALFDASRFIETSPEEAKTIVSHYTKLDKSTLDSIWSDFVFKPVITRALLNTWADEWQWLSDTGRLEQHQNKPDFGALLQLDVLKRLYPEQVRL